MRRSAAVFTVPDNGVPGVDKVPAMLTPDEFVLPTDTVRAVGKPTLERLVAATHRPVRRAAKASPAAQFKGRPVQRKADGGAIGILAPTWKREIETRQAQMQSASLADDARRAARNGWGPGSKLASPEVSAVLAAGARAGQPSAPAQTLQPAAGAQQEPEQPAEPYAPTFGLGLSFDNPPPGQSRNRFGGSGADLAPDATPYSGIVPGLAGLSAGLPRAQAFAGGGEVLSAEELRARAARIVPGVPLDSIPDPLEAPRTGPLSAAERTRVARSLPAAPAPVNSVAGKADLPPLDAGDESARYAEIVKARGPDPEGGGWYRPSPKGGRPMVEQMGGWEPALHSLSENATRGMSAAGNAVRTGLGDLEGGARSWWGSVAAPAIAEARSNLSSGASEIASSVAGAADKLGRAGDRLDRWFRPPTRPDELAALRPPSSPLYPSAAPRGIPSPRAQVDIRTADTASSPSGLAAPPRSLPARQEPPPLEGELMPRDTYAAPGANPGLARPPQAPARDPTAHFGGVDLNDMSPAERQQFKIAYTNDAAAQFAANRQLKSWNALAPDERGRTPQAVREAQAVGQGGLPSLAFAAGIEGRARAERTAKDSAAAQFASEERRAQIAADSPVRVQREKAPTDIAVAGLDLAKTGAVEQGKAAKERAKERADWAGQLETTIDHLGKGGDGMEGGGLPQEHRAWALQRATQLGDYLESQGMPRPAATVAGPLAIRAAGLLKSRAQAEQEARAAGVADKDLPSAIDKLMADSEALAMQQFAGLFGGGQ